MTVSKYLLKFIALTKEQSLAFDSKFVTKKANSGDYIIEQGEISRKIIFLQEGATSMIYEREGKTFIKDFIFKNNFASVYESFITMQPSRYALKAINDCTYLSISNHDLEQLYQKYPELKIVANKLTQSAYLNITRRMESLLTLSAKKRYLELLERRPTLLSEVPLYLIASYLGITDVALSRIRKEISQ